jgi:site-specific recombinase XerD
MNLPTVPIESSPWDQALYAFLVEKGNRSGSRRTVESYSRMLWHFFAETTPERVTPAVVLAYAHGIGLSGKTPSPVTIGAHIACLSSYFRFLIRMRLVTSNPCDLVERPRQNPSPARGYSADEIRRILEVVRRGSIAHSRTRPNSERPYTVSSEASTVCETTLRTTRDCGRGI